MCLLTLNLVIKFDKTFMSFELNQNLFLHVVYTFVETQLLIENAL